jgi:hypothetical protein
MLSREGLARKGPANRWCGSVLLAAVTIDGARLWMLDQR